MLTMVLKNVKLADNVQWICTNWEIATSMNFDRKTIIARSYMDTRNKELITFNIQFDPNTRYYGRAQIVGTDGSYEWSNLEVFRGAVLQDNPNRYYLPSPISAPDVTTNSDKDKHLPTGFYIRTGKYSTYGNGKHIATTWMIEDIDGRVVWLKDFDKLNKTEILVDDIILNHGEVYRIRAMFHSESKNTSDISTRTVLVSNTTTDGNVLKLIGLIQDYDLSSNLDISFVPNAHKGSTSLELRLTTYNDGIVYEAFRGTGNIDGSVLRIPKEAITPGQVYTVLLKYDNEEIFHHGLVDTLG